MYQVISLHHKTNQINRQSINNPLANLKHFHSDLILQKQVLLPEQG